MIEYVLELLFEGAVPFLSRNRGVLVCCIRAVLSLPNTLQ